MVLCSNGLQKIYVRMLARMGLCISGVLGKPEQALRGGFGIQAAVETLAEGVIQFERTEFAFHGGDMVHGMAGGVFDVQAG